MKTKAVLSKESVILSQFLSEQKPGSDLSWAAIEVATGVKMDTLGKGTLRRAAERLRLEYTSNHGYGIVLASAGTALPIVSERLVRIDRAVRRGDRTQQTIQEQFFASLNEDEQKRILFAGAVFGAIRVAAESGRMLYGRRDSKSPVVTIEIPRLG